MIAYGLFSVAWWLFYGYGVVPAVMIFAAFLVLSVLFTVRSNVAYIIPARYERRQKLVYVCNKRAG